MTAVETRVDVADPRSDEQRLRAAWHPEKRTIVISHWRHNVCVASTPVPVEQASALVALLVRALGEAAAAPVASAAPVSFSTLGRDAAVLAGRTLAEGTRLLRRLPWVR